MIHTFSGAFGMKRQHIVSLSTLVLLSVASSLSFFYTSGCFNEEEPAPGDEMITRTLEVAHLGSGIGLPFEFDYAYRIDDARHDFEPADVRAVLEDDQGVAPHFYNLSALASVDSSLVDSILEHHLRHEAEDVRALIGDALEDEGMRVLLARDLRRVILDDPDRERLDASDPPGHDRLYAVVILRDLDDPEASSFIELLGNRDDERGEYQRLEDPGAQLAWRDFAAGERLFFNLCFRSDASPHDYDALRLERDTARAPRVIPNCGAGLGGGSFTSGAPYFPIPVPRELPPPPPGHGGNVGDPVTGNNTTNNSAVNNTGNSGNNGGDGTIYTPSGDGGCSPGEVEHERVSICATDEEASIFEAFNDCGLCTNDMGRLLGPLRRIHQHRDRLARANQSLGNYLATQQDAIDNLIEEQESLDSNLTSLWGLDDLAGGAGADIEDIDTRIEEMREYGERYEGARDYLDGMSETLEEVKASLARREELDARIQALRDKIEGGGYGQALGALDPNCCDEGRDTSGLDALVGLERDLGELAQASLEYRNETVGITRGLTELIKHQLATRAGDEAAQIEARDKYRHGLTNFVRGEIANALVNKIRDAREAEGQQLTPAQEEALDALADNIATALGTPGDHASRTTEEILADAESDLNENDREAIAFVSGAVYQSIIEEVIAYIAPIESGALMVVMVWDQMITVPLYMWEDKNLAILRGAFDHALAGLLVAMRAARDSYSPGLGDIGAALGDAIDQPVTICLDGEGGLPPSPDAIARRFLEQTFGGAAPPEMLSSDQPGAEPYWDWHEGENPTESYLQYVDAGIRFQVRFECFCGNEMTVSKPVEQGGGVCTPEGDPPHPISGWAIEPDSRHIYELIECGDWLECQEAAAARRAHLVAINSQAEQDWLLDTFGPYRLWIGLNDVDAEGEWVWSNGEPMTYSNWAEGEPNDMWNNGEDWVHMGWDVEAGTWNDLGPESPEWTRIRHAIIERPVVLLPRGE